MTLDDDQKTYIIAGAAGAISLIAWLTLVVVPAWKSYWRLRDRLLATVLSVPFGRITNRFWPLCVNVT